MARVSFTSHLTRHVSCPLQNVAAGTVQEALRRVFEILPDVREYVLDDQGALRKHVVVFVDGRQLADRVHLSDALGPDAELHVMQALSGG
jgi:sulfur-carrier protein